MSKELCLQNARVGDVIEFSYIYAGKVKTTRYPVTMIGVFRVHRDVKIKCPIVTFTEVRSGSFNFSYWCSSMIEGASPPIIGRFCIPLSGVYASQVIKIYKSHNGKLNKNIKYNDLFGPVTLQ